MIGNIGWSVSGVGDKASGRMECGLCKTSREFVRRLTFGEGCRHLNTHYAHELFKWLQWTRTRDERLQTSRRDCGKCLTSRPVGRMRVVEDKGNTGQPIWECWDDILNCLDIVLEERRIRRRECINALTQQ